MRITRLKIGPVTYRVEPWKDADASDDASRGDFSYRLGRIRLADCYNPAATAETLIHEALHAIVAELELDWSEDYEERMCRTLAPRLAALLADNPDEVRELLRMLRR